MAQQVKVPTVGESITEVTIANWLKKDGDAVKMDEVIAELESDKATFELTAPQAGVLKISKQQGEVVPIGTVICEIADSVGAAALFVHLLQISDWARAAIADSRLRCAKVGRPEIDLSIGSARKIARHDADAGDHGIHRKRSEGGEGQGGAGR